MGMGFAPTWLRQVSLLLHKTTLTTEPLTIYCRFVCISLSLCVAVRKRADLFECCDGGGRQRWCWYQWPG